MVVVNAAAKSMCFLLFPARRLAVGSRGVNSNIKVSAYAPSDFTSHTVTTVREMFHKPRGMGKAKSKINQESSSHSVTTLDKKNRDGILRHYEW